MRFAVVFIAFRRLRAPIITLVLIFAAGITGLVLIPGTEVDGSPWRMSFAEAFYFMSYTATTIGFGEIPRAFNAHQRLWVTLLIFASVVGWAYLVASLLAVARDNAFRNAIEEARFARGIRRLREPFYLLCGFGETGALVGANLDRLGRRFVVVDINPDRIDQLALMDLTQSVPALCVDARVPEHLLEAGLSKRECRGVLALTNDDQVNLAVAMAVRLLNPETPVLARAETTAIARNMASFGTDHIVNPFARFGTHLALALAAPASQRLIDWLTTPPDQTFVPSKPPPRGHWVVAGYGRFGREVTQALRAQELDVTVIDPDESSLPGVRAINGTGTEPEPLRQAGIETAVGVVAGTDDDIVNLSIAVTAKEMNPNLFTVLRQNTQSSRALFDAFDADITMVPSQIIANGCLAEIRTPWLTQLLAEIRARDNAWAAALLERLARLLGSRTPVLWRARIDGTWAPALLQFLASGAQVPMDTLLKNPADREQPLPALALGLARGGVFQALPAAEVALAPGDEVLFAGTALARREQSAVLFNRHDCAYVLGGKSTGL
ncbi:MAG: potassium channel family protein [Pseudomonadales bacterium]